MSKPCISVIIPVKNGQSTLKKCLDSVLSLNYPYYKVIVINDGSTDKTEEILRDYTNIQIITTKGVGPSRARNMGLEIADTDFVTFTDADCVVDKEWLNELLKGFINENIAGVGGAQESPQDDSDFGKKVHLFLSTFGFVSDYMKNFKELKPTNHNPSCNVMYRKKVLSEIGGFQEGLWPGEDVELDYRIKKKGYVLMFNPYAVVYHYRPDNLKGFMKMMFRYGKAQGWLVRKYGFFRKIHYLPILISFFIVSFLYNKFVWWLIILVLLMVLFIYLSKLLLKPLTFLMLMSLFIISLIFWNIGFICGIMQHNQK